MKQQNIRNSGFILVDATVGIALFCFITIVIMRASALLTTTLSDIEQRNALLCSLTRAAYDPDYTEDIEDTYSSYIPAYTHPSITWHCYTARRGKQVITLYSARSTA